MRAARARACGRGQHPGHLPGPGWPGVVSAKILGPARLPCGQRPTCTLLGSWGKCRNPVTSCVKGVGPSWGFGIGATQGQVPGLGCRLKAQAGTGYSPISVYPLRFWGRGGTFRWFSVGGLSLQPCNWGVEVGLRAPPTLCPSRARKRQASAR